MADSFIIIDEPVVIDKKLDTEQLTVGANTVERERFIIAGQGATDLVKPVAHNAVDVGSPLPIGGYGSTATPTAASADGNRVRAWFDLNGRLKVDGSSVTQPISAASLPLPAGASTAAKQPALGTAGTASADVITVQGIAAMTALKVDGSAVTQPVSGTVTATQATAANLNATVVGTGTFAVQAAQSGTWTVQPGNTANTTAWKVDGSAVTQPVSIAATVATKDIPQTSGGYSTTSFAAAASNNATALKASAGQVYALNVFNNANYPIYLKFYNKATAPAPATDNALLIKRIGIQAGTSMSLAYSAGVPFGTGIGYVLVKGISDTDNTSVAANDAVVDIAYA